MIDRIDLTFKDALEREIAHRLNGDPNVTGLYRSVLACSNWDDYQRIRAMILTYEEVIKMGRELARRMNEGEEPVRAQPHMN